MVICISNRRYRIFNDCSILLTMKKLLVFVLFLGLTVLLNTGVQVQCAMCKIAAESGTQADNSPVLGLNQGILYLAVVPYISFSVIAFLWWRGYKRRQKEEAELGY